ncbi:carboxypeptidase-like regulatory domain-containing protein [Flavobacterium gelidilacus]|uniref:carboxypeptidase-like regulatory domain-containing protein n=1 Tax=Flavobacterium gelidilacus TaxID=206041 RepID=UPI0003F91121|nr:carboxypeptidase-like regulatory domain-containing protein [Flavobacterium gelidilacus]
MKEQRLLFLLLLTTFSLSAQVKGVVLDSISGKPIAYAAVIYENSRIGVNTDENGVFELPKKDSLQYIQISNLGYNSKTVLKSNSLIINISPKVYELNEVVVIGKLNTQELTLGVLKKERTSYGNGGTSHMWGMFFNFENENKAFQFIKEIKFTTRSRVKNSKIKLRIFTINSSKEIETDILEDEIIITCKKGKQLQIIDLTSYNLIFPKEGLMIAFESLVIEENKFEYKYTTEGKKGRFNGVTYEPHIVGYFDTEPNVYLIKDNKASLFNFQPKGYKTYHNMSLLLTLTN